MKFFKGACIGFALCGFTVLMALALAYLITGIVTGWELWVLRSLPLDILVCLFMGCWCAMFER